LARAGQAGRGDPRAAARREGTPVSRPHRRAAVIAGAIALIAGTVAPGVHRAAADPPGFPSKPGGQPTPQTPKLPSAAAAPPGSPSTPAGKPTPKAPRAAADPPGYPSKPGGQPAPQTSNTPTLDDFARERVVALKKFVRDKEADPMFAEHE